MLYKNLKPDKELQSKLKRLHVSFVDRFISQLFGNSIRMCQAKNLSSSFSQDYIRELWSKLKGSVCHPIDSLISISIDNSMRMCQEKCFTKNIHPADALCYFWHFSTYVSSKKKLASSPSEIFFSSRKVTRIKCYSDLTSCN